MVCRYKNPASATEDSAENNHNCLLFVKVCFQETVVPAVKIRLGGNPRAVTCIMVKETRDTYEGTTKENMMDIGIAIVKGNLHRDHLRNY